jgi:hypothetical protein
MPAKGSRKIPKKEKAQIIAEKRIKTATEVALTHGIAVNTVYSVEAKATDEILALADKYHENITEQAKLNVLAGLRTMHPKMADPNASLKDLTGAVKANHDILQVRTGQPTSITGTDNSPENRCRNWISMYLDTKDPETGKKPTVDDAIHAFEHYVDIEGATPEIKARVAEQMRRGLLGT